MRQADFIEVALANLNAALRDGTLLVVLVTVVFLANIRAAAITLVAIPLSLVAAVIGLRIAGLSINSMTLGGLAIAIGALVDDAIIDVENILRRLRENATRPEDERRPVPRDRVRREQGDPGIDRLRHDHRDARVPAAVLPCRCRGPAAAATGARVLIALFASLIVALTVTPVLSFYLLPRLRSVREGHEPAVSRWLKRRYGRSVPWALDHRKDGIRRGRPSTGRSPG